MGLITWPMKICGRSSYFRRPRHQAHENNYAPPPPINLDRDSADPTHSTHTHTSKNYTQYTISVLLEITEAAPSFVDDRYVVVPLWRHAIRPGPGETNTENNSGATPGSLPAEVEPGRAASTAGGLPPRQVISRRTLIVFWL